MLLSPRSKKPSVLIPIIVVTGTDTRNLRTSDFSALLKKPVSTDSLLETIEDALRAGRI